MAAIRQGSLSLHHLEEAIKNSVFNRFFKVTHIHNSQLGVVAHVPALGLKQGFES
jgi:hypothetical protein